MAIDITADQRTYDAIIATLEGRATTDQEEYRIGTRMLKRIPLPELQALAQSYYTRIMAAKAQNAGESLFRTVSTE